MTQLRVAKAPKNTIGIVSTHRISDNFSNVPSYLGNVGFMNKMFKATSRTSPSSSASTATSAVSPSSQRQSSTAPPTHRSRPHLSLSGSTGPCPRDTVVESRGKIRGGFTRVSFTAWRWKDRRGIGGRDKNQLYSLYQLRDGIITRF